MQLKLQSNIFLLLAILVVSIFMFIDTSLLSRCLWTVKTTKDVPEYFLEGKSGKNIKTPYINLTAAKLVSAEDSTRRVSATKDVTQCRDSCTYDDACVGFVFNSVKDDCKLLYDISGYEPNKEGLFTVSSGIKLREFVDRQNDPDRKLLRFEGMELPPDDVGKLATHKFIQNVDSCKNKCLAHSDITGKCIAFEYDFVNKACTLNAQVQGKMKANASKDTYIMIN